MKRVLVIGYGVSGKATMALLKAKGFSAVAVDRNPEAGVLIDDADFPLEDVAQIVLSPGVTLSHPIVQRAKEMGIEVIGELELGLRWTQNRCVGITGSNGKTTTTLMVAHMLNVAGIPAKAVGNVGVALSSYLLSADPKEILIVEMSSFQLETTRTKKLEAAVYLNLTPNHLDRHASMAEYAAAKANIQDCIVEGGPLFVSSQVWREYKHTLKPEAVVIFDENIAPILPEEYRTLQNVMAAISLCGYLEVSEKTCLEALQTFQKPPHRIEWVATLEGVHYFNDSKATSVEAVLHAVHLLEGPMVLIAGGVDKGAPYTPWIGPFREKVRKIVAYGEAASKMRTELSGAIALETVVTFAEAVALAKKEAKCGETVLLSPGCSSYDQFQSYEHRGDAFKKIVTSRIS